MQQNLAGWTPSPEGGQAGAPAGPGRRCWLKPTRQGEHGDELEVGKEAEGGDLPGRRGSHSLPPETPPPSVAHPPSRSLAAGCCKAAVPQPDSEWQCLAAWAFVALLPLPPARPSRDRGCSPAMRRSGEHSGGGGKGLWAHCAALRTRRRSRGLDALRPLQEQVKAAGGRRDCRSGFRVPGAEIPGRRVETQSQGSGGRPGQRHPNPKTWGTGTIRLQPASRSQLSGPKGSEASARGGSWHAAGVQAKLGAPLFPWPSSFWRASRPPTPLPPALTAAEDVFPSRLRKRLTSRPSSALELWATLPST